MRETGLMCRVFEAAIRHPAVAHEDAGKIGAEQRRGFRKSAPRLNDIHGRLGRRRRPQPLQVRIHFPSGLIGCDDGTSADLLAEGFIRRGGALRGPTHGMHEAAGRDRESPPLAKQRGNLAERQSELLIQHDSQRHGCGAELRAGRADRIRRLQRVAPLDAPATVGTLANGDIECAHDGAHVGEVFLILRGVPSADQPAATVWARRRERGGMALMDVRRDRPMGFAAVRRAGFAAGTAWVTTGCPTRKRSRLSVQCSLGGIELVFQALDLLAHAVTLATQPPILPLAPLQLGDQLLARSGAPARAGYART